MRGSTLAEIFFFLSSEKKDSVFDERIIDLPSYTRIDRSLKDRLEWNDNDFR